MYKTMDSTNSLKSVFRFRDWPLFMHGPRTRPDPYKILNPNPESRWYVSQEQYCTMQNVRNNIKKDLPIETTARNKNFQMCEAKDAFKGC